MLYGLNKPLTHSGWSDERREDICPHCGRTLEDPSELLTGLCNSDDCPRHDDPEHVE
jgi:hypothetical protein